MVKQIKESKQRAVKAYWSCVGMGVSVMLTVRPVLADTGTIWSRFSAIFDSMEEPIDNIWKRAKPWRLPVGLTLLVFILLRYVFLIGYVPTESMEPTLPKGSFILGLRIFEEPKVGDIIVFEKDGALLVKRIAAGPGDWVDLSQLTYMTSLSIPVWEETIIAVPEGCYYVLGDNTQNSWDSRYWEYTFVLRSDIVAVVIPKNG